MYKRQQGESVVLSADGECSTLVYLPGIAPDDAHYAARVGVNVQVETSQDGVNWTDCGTLSDGSIFAWKKYTLTTPGRFVRLTALDGSVTTVSYTHLMDTAAMPKWQETALPCCSTEYTRTVGRW